MDDLCPLKPFQLLIRAKVDPLRPHQTIKWPQISRSHVVPSESEFLVTGSHVSKGAHLNGRIPALCKGKQG